MTDKGREGTLNRAGPYRDLYIYLIEGQPSGALDFNGGDEFIGNWVEADSAFLFFSKPADEAVSRLLGINPGLELAGDYHFTYEQWQGGGLEPLRIGKFLIVPPWKEAEPAEGEIRMLLNPGVVFGNGLHPTTRDCLKALAFAGRQGPVKRVLDLGTGTGVLALAAAFLGAEHVLAVDLNPLCVKTTMENVKLNGFTEIIRAVEGPAEAFADEVADLAVANIHYEVIQRLVEMRGFRSKKRLIISGLMRSQYRDIRAQLERFHFRIAREWDRDMTWFTVFAISN